MRKIAVLLICVLFYANVVPIVAETPEITEARIAGKNDAKGFKWEWFAASYMTTNASVIAVALASRANEYWLNNSFDNIDPACLFAIYGSYVLAPTAVAIIDSPTPPANHLLGKSPEWVNAYTKAYQKTMRRYRAESSAAGCVWGAGILAATVYVLAPAIVGGTSGDVD